MDNPIELADITDVVIVIKAKGQSWLVMPRQGEDKELAKEMRKLLISMLVTEKDGMHSILDTPYNKELLDKIKSNLKK